MRTNLEGNGVAPPELMGGFWDIFKGTTSYTGPGGTNVTMGPSGLSISKAPQPGAPTGGIGGGIMDFVKKNMVIVIAGGLVVGFMIYKGSKG
jgi:hypothetical protein